MQIFNFTCAPNIQEYKNTQNTQTSSKAFSIENIPPVQRKKKKVRHTMQKKLERERGRGSEGENNFNKLEQMFEKYC